MNDEYIYLWRDGGMFVQTENRQLKLNDTASVITFFDEVRSRADHVNGNMKKIPYDSIVWSKCLDFGVGVGD